MSRGQIIWIDADDTAPLLGQMVEDGVVGATAPIAEIEQADGADWVVAFAPVSAVRLVTADLPSLPQLQRDAIARERFSSAFAGPVHLTSSLPVDEKGRVAWVDPARLSGWQARIREAGWEADAILPAALLIGEEDVPCRAQLCGEDVWGLADDIIPADLGAEGEMPKRAINPLSLGQSAAALAESPPLNLLTGAFGPRRSSSFAAQKGKILGLVAGIAVVTALIPAAQAWRANHDAAKLEEQSQSLAASSFAQSANPVAALGEAVSARQGGGAGFGPTLQSVSAAVEVIPDAELSLIAFAPDGWMNVTVRASNAGEIAQIKRKLESAGFRVTQGPVVAEQGRQSAQIRVRG